MGALCSCFGDSESKEPSQTTPLLRDGQSRTTPSSHFVPSYAQAPAPQSAGSEAVPHSARKYRPDVKENEFSSSLDHVAPVSMQLLPLQLAALNKTFQDHAKLYNEQYQNFKDLRQSLNDFKGKFVVETSGIPVMADCLKVLAQRCDGAKLTAKRGKQCIQLEYDPREVSEKCSGLPEDTLETLELYNKLNHLIKSILEKSPQVSRSLQIVLEDEHNLKKEVTKSDLPSSEGPEAFRRCTENINQLRKLPGFIETIQKYTRKTFKEILEGSKVLLSDGDEKNVKV